MEDFQLSQLSLDEFENGEADSYSNWSLNPIHTEALVESLPDALRSSNVPQRCPYRSVDLIGTSHSWQKHRQTRVT